MARKEKKRGVLLTIWLIFMFVANSFALVSFLVLNKTFASLYPNIPLQIFYISSLLSLINILCLLFLFMWKKWAFFVLCGITILGFIMNIAFGLGLISSIAGLIGPVILYLILRPKWNLFT